MADDPGTPRRKFLTLAAGSAIASGVTPGGVGARRSAHRTHVAHHRTRWLDGIEDRTVSVSQGRFSDEFDGYGVHIYRIAHPR